MSNVFLLTVRGRADGPRGLFKNWDRDGDGQITTNEVILE